MIAEFRGQNLDGNYAVKLRIFYAIHLTHAPERRKNFVKSNFVAASPRHRWNDNIVVQSNDVTASSGSSLSFPLWPFYLPANARWHRLPLRFMAT